MSYIPKYILKRMFPKKCVVVVDGGVNVEMINVISPMALDEIPGDAINYLDVLIDGVKLSDDDKNKVSLTLDEKTYTFANMKEFEGTTIPVGGILKIFVPCAVASGEEHEFDVKIATDSPFEVKFKRTIA